MSKYECQNVKNVHICLWSGLRGLSDWNIIKNEFWDPNNNVKLLKTLPLQTWCRPQIANYPWKPCFWNFGKNVRCPLTSLTREKLWILVFKVIIPMEILPQLKDRGITFDHSFSKSGKISDRWSAISGRGQIWEMKIPWNGNNPEHKTVDRFLQCEIRHDHSFPKYSSNKRSKEV